MEINKIYQGDVLEVLKTLPTESIDCIVTSPPYYGLRDYGVEGQLGLEKTLEEFLQRMLLVTAELKRVLKKTGTMWWNHGDSYGGNGMSSEKSLLLQAHRLAIKMVDEQQWILRNIIIWHKPNVMPSSVEDRFTVDYEPVFFFTKSKKYYFERQFEPQTDWGERDRTEGKYKDAGLANGLSGIINPLGRNKRTVWKIPTQAYSEAHFATFPSALIATPIKAGCPTQICKKCGKAREAIFEPSEEYQKLLGKGFNDHSADMERGLSYTNQKTTSTTADYKKIGYTNCGCNAGWEKGIVLDPFMGSGTTGRVALDLGRNYLGIELNSEYIKLAEKRLSQQTLSF